MDNPETESCHGANPAVPRRHRQQRQPSAFSDVICSHTKIANINYILCYQMIQTEEQLLKPSLFFMCLKWTHRHWIYFTSIVPHILWKWRMETVIVWLIILSSFFFFKWITIMYMSWFISSIIWNITWIHVLLSLWIIIKDVIVTKKQNSLRLNR